MFMKPVKYMTMRTLNIAVSVLIMFFPVLISCDGNVYNNLFNHVCSLLYDDNDSTAGSVPAEPVVYKPGDVITVPDNTGILQKTNFSFIGWNTADDGSGTTYTAGQTLIMGTSTVTLYALWSGTITYDANSGTGSIAPQDIYYNASETLLPNTFTRTNYIFSGWALSSAASSADYNDESSYHMTDGNVTLYAVWSPDIYSLTFNANGATSGTMAPQSIAYGTAENISTNLFSKTGYTFAGWSTVSGGSVAYTDGQSYTMTTTGAILYAVWQGTITYNSNGGTGSMGSQTIYYNNPVTLTSNSFTRTGYSFAGWNTSADNSGNPFADSASYNLNLGSQTLYAQWTAGDYTITFNANGATFGTMAAQHILYGSSANISLNQFSRTGYTFAGWSTTLGGAVVYADQASYTMSSTGSTLYAVWTANNYTITFHGNGSDGGSMTDQTIACGSSANLTANAFTLTGYSFAGWATTSGGTAVYADQVSYTMGPGDVDLYAKWTTRTIHHITNDAQLNAMRGGVIAGWTSDDYYILDVDIDLSANYSGGWIPIGTSAAPFTGELHAGNHTISNLKITGSGNNQGLFGYLSDATLQGLNLTGVNVSAAGYDYIGALAGYSDSSTISGCSVAGTLVRGDAYVGGMVGYNSGTITSCSGEVPVNATDTDTGGLVGTNSGEVTYSYTTAAAPVQGRLYIGGLIGLNDSTATVSHCYALNSVTGVSNPYDTGGLIGRNFADVTKCYATGNVSGWVNAGGLIGLNLAGTSVTYCYSKGSVAGSSGSIRIGGLIGELQTGCIVNYGYSTGVVTSTGSNGGLIGALNGSSCTVTNSYYNNVNTNNTYGTPVSLANMQVQPTYTDWDFAAMWAISGSINGGYPYLQELVP